MARLCIGGYDKNSDYKLMYMTCGNCGGKVYSLKHEKCLICGEPITDIASHIKEIDGELIDICAKEDTDIRTRAMNKGE